MANGSAQYTWLKNDLAASSSIGTLPDDTIPCSPAAPRSAAQQRPSRSGTCCSRPGPMSSWPATSTTTSGSPLRRPTVEPTRATAYGSSWSAPVGKVLERGALTTAAQQPGFQWDDVGSVGPAAGGGWLSLEVRTRGRQDLQRCRQHSVPRKARLLSTEAPPSCLTGPVPSLRSIAPPLDKGTPGESRGRKATGPRCPLTKSPSGNPQQWREYRL